MSRESGVGSRKSEVGSRKSEVGELGSRVVGKENTRVTQHKKVRGLEMIYFNSKPLTLLK